MVNTAKRMRRILIDVPGQRLTVTHFGKPVYACVVSTALRGTGFQPGSLRTPTGRFAIAEKIGGGKPLGAVFRGRVATGETINPQAPEDQISTRILWLTGLDPENKNTLERYIYVHGTNDEATLGWPTSHGCVRLANEAMWDVYDLVEAGDEVRIN